MNKTKEDVSIAILNRALQTYKPSLIICSYSGGYDSMSAAHLVGRWYKRHAHSTNVITASVDTLISADGKGGYDPDVELMAHRLSKSQALTPVRP